MSASHLEGSLASDRCRGRASHTLYKCLSAEQFCLEFAALTGYTAKTIADHAIEPGAPRAVILVGSLPLGMATRTSSLEFIVLVDSSSVFLDQRRESFTNDGSNLRAGSFVRNDGVMAEVTVVNTPAVVQIYKALRKRGPELGEAEIITLGGLSSGWLLWQSDEYLALRGVKLNDPAIDIYCSTKHFSYALIWRRKAAKALEFSDIPLALHLARSSVEMAYLAYFASVGLSYLGPNWLAQLGYARGSEERVSRHPLLKKGIPLLFPSCNLTHGEAGRYLKEISEYLALLRDLIGQNPLFRIAFDACPQIFPAEET